MSSRRRLQAQRDLMMRMRRQQRLQDHLGDECTSCVAKPHS